MSIYLLTYSIYLQKLKLLLLKLQASLVAAFHRPFSKRRYAVLIAYQTHRALYTRIHNTHNVYLTLYFYNITLFRFSESLGLCSEI